MPQVKELMDKANSLQEENTDLMLSNRDLIGARIEFVPQDIKELLWGAEESAWEEEDMV